MSYSELIQVIGLSSLLTLALIVVLIRFGRHFLAVVQGLLPPRYLKSCGVRRRVPAQSEPHEPV
ncbi:cellulose biosynthesis protein BcsF [Pseudomonas sp. UYIF39]|uniref:cellulose biosynthesis protein BcsF n=1 Tax=Pseudomonas TaxID=286 RepID=UPI00249DB00B|nr:cellulose biosynthesis protein BcsF [Pseudomonas sp. UYIF39]MDI3358473.1 cellulose biosynthesis protein BcsF [Pseudomonas sp. UYIF39]